MIALVLLSFVLLVVLVTLFLASAAAWKEMSSPSTQPPTPVRKVPSTQPPTPVRKVLRTNRRFVRKRIRATN